MASGNLRLILLAVFLSIASGPAFGQVIPGPGAGRDLFIRDRTGKVIEHLHPDGDHYDFFTAQNSFILAGRAELTGPRLVIYDAEGRIVATARPELLPPDSPLYDITTVRNADGDLIGTLGRN